MPSKASTVLWKLKQNDLTHMLGSCWKLNLSSGRTDGDNIRIKNPIPEPMAAKLAEGPTVDEGIQILVGEG